MSDVKVIPVDIGVQPEEGMAPMEIAIDDERRLFYVEIDQPKEKILETIENLKKELSKDASTDE